MKSARLLHAAVAAIVATAAFMPALAADAADPERLAEARALLAAMHIERQIDGMSSAMAESMSKQIGQGRPVANQRAMQVILEESMLGMKERLSGPDGLVEGLAQAYASQFNFAELRQIREFYESPAGQHMLQASPEVMRQILPRMMESGRAAAPRVCARAKERMAAEKIEGAATMKCPEAP